MLEVRGSSPLSSTLKSLRNNELRKDFSFGRELKKWGERFLQFYIRSITMLLTEKKPV